uniref:G_PROTEIN_RECEP_F1_2 domain-containing protein n=1 Tax=Loa loa TaxID=7209 RepID=A0A1I7VDA5_LOALO
MDHNIELASNIFLFTLNILQILANLTVLLAYFTNSQLLANENIILLVSLAAIDLFYSTLSIPYLIVLLSGWVPNGKEYHYNEYIVLGFGSTPAALMKSGCTITTLIALDRIWALSAPMNLLFGGFVFSLLMAGFDFSLIFVLSNGIKPIPGCSNFACFTSESFRTYWGMSNMVVNLLSCLLTIVVALLLKTRKMRNAIGNNTIVRKKEDKWASRASFYVLIVSAVFGVVPGGINGCAQRIESELSNQTTVLFDKHQINEK